jgi:hypothetical protein
MGKPPLYTGPMITRALGLATVLALILAVNAPALAKVDLKDLGTTRPIPGYPGYEITDNGVLIEGYDVVLGKCSKMSQHDELYSKKRVKACEAAGYSPSLTDTGGPPIVLVPIALLVAGGLLIRKTIAI